MLIERSNRVMGEDVVGDRVVGIDVDGDLSISRSVRQRVRAQLSVAVSD